MSKISLLPAYGRNYNNLREVLSDWNDGKDFRILNGPYTSIRDLTSLKNLPGIDMIEFLWIENRISPKNYCYWKNQATKIIPTTFVEVYPNA